MIVQRLADQHPGMLIAGEHEHRFVVCCSVTKLPIFDGDRVYFRDDGHEKVFVLADAVTVNVPGIETVIATQEMIS